MSAEWFILKEGDQYGPYNWDQMQSFAAEGRLTGSDYVWQNGMDDWVPAASITGLFQQPAPGMSQPGTEKVLGIVPGLQKKTGLMSYKTYTMVVTERQLIFAELTNQMLKTALQEANEESKGKGFFARWGDSATSQDRIYQRYFTMSADAILAENPDNFAVNKNEIKNIKMQLGQDYDDHRQQDMMFIHTHGEKMKFLFHYGGAMGNAKKILRNAHFI